jgi:hypothetical protein
MICIGKEEAKALLDIMAKTGYFRDFDGDSINTLLGFRMLTKYLSLEETNQFLLKLAAEAGEEPDSVPHEYYRFMPILSKDITDEIVVKEGIIAANVAKIPIDRTGVVIVERNAAGARWNESSRT